MSRALFLVTMSFFAVGVVGEARDVAAAQPDSDSPAAQVPSREWHGLVGASAIASTYDWLSFEPGDTLLQWHPDGTRSLTSMSEFSPGPGFGIALGGVGRHLAGPVSVAGAIDYFHVYHSTSFEGGAEPDTKASGTLQVLRFQLRAIWDSWRVKPFLAFAPGLSRLSLPDQELRWSSTSQEATVVDAWTSGLSLATQLGALYELRPNLLLNANVGHHIEVFNRTNELELDPESIAAHGFTVALGLEWWL